MQHVALYVIVLSVKRVKSCKELELSMKNSLEYRQLLDEYRPAKNYHDVWIHLDTHTFTKMFLLNKEIYDRKYPHSGHGNNGS